ncbi:membrane lipoprotein lipid attachment site-containing protein [Palleronia caenipelagi]|uniref:17 kDa surface antigen n=1 Tax=Palleronia caenipelagi TaxID=2489174 RepID=A0A547Q8N2_9RHOB|nr:membrane lipoprotein lipid attachment site-containing protein [Palleronia caenipelagi]TRD22749.1 glycine zipper 2TM domain-containing protein [Palleronia caenipelagi]
MKKFLIALPLVALVAGCQSGGNNQGALTGAALGAATGLAVSGDDDRAAGALVGAAVGAAAGNYIGQNNNGQCVYENANGQRYTAACP